MGTRSLTIFEDSYKTKGGRTKREEVAVLYRQMDGYPTGHGEELSKFLAPIKIVNGLGVRKEVVANGMGCLAAQAVAHFKTEPGDFYLHPSGTRDVDEQYIYTVYEKGGSLNIRCATGYGPKKEDWTIIYDGPAKGFDGEKIEKADA